MTDVTGVRDLKSPYAKSVAAAADRHHVPLNVLVGVWGLETGFGANVKTSSAGAVGDFQFLPSTASGYGYPLTNTPTQAQFDLQANAAARYLADLHHQTGDWDTALRHYSGGGYGLKEVTDKAAHWNVGGSDAADITGAVGSVVHTVTSWTGALSDLIGKLLSPSFWLHALEIVGGLILLILGLNTLTGGSISSAAKAVA